jgi:polysaccharide export outer membrane protein
MRLPAFFEIFFLIPFFLLISACSRVEYEVIGQDSEYLAKLQQDRSYLIGCGDMLEVLVWGHAELTTNNVVRPDGNISLPLIGDIQAEGLTVDDLKKEMNRRMGEYIQEPSVSVSVSEINSLKIYIIGEVRAPGEQDLISYTTVLHAIARAGGFTDFAKRNKIQIIRTQGNEKIKIKFNYNQVIKGKKLDQNIPLRPGDVILVP